MAKSLIELKAINDKKANINKRKFEETGKNKYDDRYTYHKSIVDSCDKLLSKPNNSTKINNRSYTYSPDHSNKVASDINLLNQNRINSKSKQSKRK